MSELLGLFVGMATLFFIAVATKIMWEFSYAWIKYENLRASTLYTRYKNRLKEEDIELIELEPPSLFKTKRQNKRETNNHFESDKIAIEGDFK